MVFYVVFMNFIFTINKMYFISLVLDLGKVNNSEIHLHLII